MALLSAGFRQDVSEGTFVERVLTGCLRSHKNRQQSEGEDGTFLGRVPTGCQRSRENRLQQCSPAKTHVHELESKNCELSLMAKMALLLEGFRQDV